MQDVMKKDIYSKFLLILTWLSLFLSINLNPAEFFEYGLFNKIRLLSPIFLVILILIFRFKYFKILNFSKIYLLSFYSIFFLYFFFNLITPNNQNINIFWPLYMFISFLFLQSFTDFDEKKLLLIFTVVIIFFGFIFYFSLSMSEMISTRTRYHFYGVMGGDMGYTGFENPPRSSGLARLSLILFSFVLYYYLINEKKGNYILLISLSFLGIFSLIFQSRTISFIYFFLIFFTILFYYKKFFYDKRLLVFTLILPLIINFSYNINFIKKYGDENSKKSLVVNALQNIVLRDQINLEKNSKRFSSNRFNNWKLASDIIKKNYFKGYGAQADRFLINQSVHNSLLYTTLASGLFGGISLIYIYIHCIILLIKFYFTGFYKSCKSSLPHFAASILILICLRSILETSFAVFSIDFLVFIIAFLFFANHLEKYQ